MFSPIGNLPPSVYWRRRLLVIGGVVLLVVLLVVTLRAMMGGGGNTAPVADASSTRSSTTPGPTTPTGTTSSRAASKSGSAKHEATTRTSAGARTSSPPMRCKSGDLALQAVAGKPSYQVGQKPIVELQVTNTGARPCTQDLADKQVVLKVYNGESRVWGSHDCEIQSGTDVRTLLVDRPVRISLEWSANTSQEGCKGTRQKVGAGTYTLYATLSGKDGKATTFSIA